MTDKTNETSKIDALKERLQNMSRRSAAESCVHIAMAALCNDGQHLATEQKADLVNAALDMHRNVILSEFLRILTSPPDGSPYDLLIDKGDPEKMKKLQALVAASVIKTDDMSRKHAERFQTMFEVFFPRKEATANG